MPFDCIPVIDPPRQVSPAAADTLDIRGFSPAVPLRSRASPTWFCQSAATWHQYRCRGTDPRSRSYLRRAAVV